MHTTVADVFPDAEVAPPQPTEAMLRAAGAGQRAGDGMLRVERVRGRSVVVRARANSPMKLLTPRPKSGDGATAHAVVSGYGGGLVSGDHLRLRLDVGDAARCRLGTQASTKVYKRLPHGRASRQTLEATVGRDAVLAIAPDPVTCFAGAAYEQSQRIDLHESSSLLLIDWLTSGRWAGGERWAFDLYRSRTEATVAGRRVLLDALRLDPSDGPIAAPHRCGRFNCIATVVLLGPAFAAASEALLARVAGEPLARQAPLLAAASPIGGGVVLRVMGGGAEPVGQYIGDRLARAAEVLGVPLFDRKW